MSAIPDINTMPGVPIQIVVVRDWHDTHVTSEVWYTRSVWHRDEKGHSTGDVLVSTELREGWAKAHEQRARDILDTDLIYEVERTVKFAALPEVGTATSRWAIAEEGGWGD